MMEIELVEHPKTVDADNVVRYGLTEFLADYANKIAPKLVLYHSTLDHPGPSDATELARILAQDQTLVELELSYRFQDDDIRHIIHALSHHPTLRALTIRGSHLSHSGLQALAALLHDNPSLQQLSMQRCHGLEGTGFTMLATAIAANPCLTTLELNNCGLKQAAINQLAPAIHGLSKLILANNFIKLEAATEFLTALKDTRTLIYLDLSYTNLYSPSICCLAEALSCNTSLRILNLDDNPMGDPGIMAIAKMLLVNRTLEELYLSLESNMVDIQTEYVSDTGGEMLLEAMAYNKTVCELELRDRNIGYHIIEEIFTYTQRNSELKQSLHQLACKLLAISRCIALSLNSPNMLAQLPVDLLAHILGDTDDQALITRTQVTNIINYAKDPQTLGKTKADFLSQTGCDQFRFFQSSPPASAILTALESESTLEAERETKRAKC